MEVCLTNNWQNNDLNNSCLNFQADTAHFRTQKCHMEYITKQGWIPNMAMDQYLLPSLVGWTSIYQLFWGSLGVPGFWPIPNITINYNKDVDHFRAKRFGLNHRGLTMGGSARNIAVVANGLTITAWWWLEHWKKSISWNFIIPTDKLHHFSEG